MAQKNLIKRIISSPILQAILIYVSGAWIALEITDYIITNYGLNDKVRDVSNQSIPLLLVCTVGLSGDKCIPSMVLLAMSLATPRSILVGCYLNQFNFLSCERRLGLWI